MTDKIWEDANAEALASAIREALRRSPGDPCSCMRDDEQAIHRGCYGVCEDAVDRVVAAITGKPAA